MTSFERFENRLPALLDELAAPRLPDYADDLFARTAATHQRPGWTFPERWIPMSALAQRLAAVPPVPWRLGVAVALLIVVAILAVIVAGTRGTRPAPPFGPASNGVIPYMSNGKLYLGDLASGNTQLLGDAAGQPHFSPDGTMISFIRTEPLKGHPVINIHIVRPDGSEANVIRPPEPIFDSDWVWMGWTPDSRHIAIIHPVDGVNQLDVFDATDNGSVQRIASAAGLTQLAFRPPDGQKILIRAPGQNAKGEDGFALYEMAADGSSVRMLAQPAVAGDTLDLTSATYTPDGRRIFFNRWTDDASVGDPGCCQLYVMSSDGGDEREFIPNPGGSWDGDAAVSPDGTRIAFWHNPPETRDHGIFVARSDGTSPLVETGPPIHGLGFWVWSPDSSRILMYMRDESNAPAYVLDPAGGPWTTTPWSQDNDIDWQRVAPPS